VEEALKGDPSPKTEDIVLGQDTIEKYLSCRSYAGAVIGRCANRIANAKFELEGETYCLEKNFQDMNIHSGSGRYAYRLFSAEDTSSDTVPAVSMHLKDNGEGGFPGSVSVTVRYALNDSNELSIEYEAYPTQSTPINITNHCYFNLAGHDSGPIDDHIVQVSADYYLPNLPSGLPDGEVISVSGSPFDLRSQVSFRQCFETVHPQMRGGFDHNFCVSGRGMRLAAFVAHPESGRMMRVYTDLEGMQLFTSNGMIPDFVSKGGAIYQRHAAYCFETQHYPNAVNYCHFPSCIYDPAHPFISKTVYSFGIMDDSK
jgi:aldose 1-epimerase